MRVLIADDHHVVRQGTRLFLESMGVKVIGEASDGREAVVMTRDLQPDVVIMDIRMPELTGIEATRRIRHENRDVRLLVLTAHDNASYVQALLEAGADGYVLKTAHLTELYKALSEVAAGRSAFDEVVINRAADLAEDSFMPVESLTDRELEVLTMAAKGLTNKQMGESLFISDRTVQGHLQNIYRKLGVTTRTEAVTKGLANGMIVLEKDE